MRKKSKAVEVVKTKMLPNYERETICRTCDDQDSWVVTTASPKYIRKLEKLGYVGRTIDYLHGYKEFDVRLGGVRFGSSVKKKMTQTHIDNLKAAILKSKTPSAESNLGVKSKKT